MVIGSLLINLIASKIIKLCKLLSKMIQKFTYYEYIFC